jgi:UDP-N-acetylmuramoyl-tripeptide--D-alanyl-D-alanine ligase
MISFNLHQAAAITGATLVGKPLRFAGVTTDSRGDCRGRLFVALQGENFDGEAFCQNAIDRGAVAIMVRQAQDVSVPQLLVNDTLSGLSALAAAWHRQVAPQTFAITGSNGKTTVKDMLASILAMSHRTHATSGNFNNEIGVPLTVCAMPEDTQMAVIEMGAAQSGDIQKLTRVVRPDVAIVTNISEAHSGRFGSLEAIARGKAELYQALQTAGVAILNRDDAHYATLRKAAGSARCLSFGQHLDSDVRVMASGECVIRLPDGQQLTINLPVAGRHNAFNAAAAVAAAWSQAVKPEDLRAGLESFQPPAGRLQSRGQIQGVTLLDDSYNANPASVKAAIDVLKDSTRPAWLVLGDMAELGENSESLHRSIGEYARLQGIDALWAVGPRACQAAQAMGEKGHCFQSKQELVKALWNAWPQRGTVLVKASRSARMEEVVNELMKREQAA